MLTYIAHNTAREIHSARQVIFHDILTLDSVRNQLTWHPGNIVIPLNDAQKRFFNCLLMKVTSKQQIISIVWNERAYGISDNNYHQLLFQSRALLKRHKLPDGLLVTIPYHGVRLNEDLLLSSAKAYS
jgi:DNA-binding winged helix-turn-helix (wHTH) protein